MTHSRTVCEHDITVSQCRCPHSRKPISSVVSPCPFGDEHLGYAAVHPAAPPGRPAEAQQDDGMARNLPCRCGQAGGDHYWTCPHYVAIAAALAAERARVLAPIQALADGLMTDGSRAFWREDVPDEAAGAMAALLHEISDRLHAAIEEAGR